MDFKSLVEAEARASAAVVAALDGPESAYWAAVTAQEEAWANIEEAADGQMTWLHRKLAAEAKALAGLEA